MAELLVGADVEAAVVVELAALAGVGFEDVPVGTRLPDPLVSLPDEFVRVVVTGGGERDLVTESPSVTVEFFAAREKRAADGARMALAVLQRAARSGSLGGVTCYRVVAFALPVNLPHPLMPDRFRYQVTVSIDLRRSAV